MKNNGGLLSTPYILLSSLIIDDSDDDGGLPSLPRVFNFEVRERKKARRLTPEEINEEIGPAPTVSEYLNRGRGIRGRWGKGRLRGRGRAKGKQILNYIEEQDEN